jgi:hypothetical protein
MRFRPELLPQALGRSDIDCYRSVGTVHDVSVDDLSVPNIAPPAHTGPSVHKRSVDGLVDGAGGMAFPRCQMRITWHIVQLDVISVLSNYWYAHSAGR